MHVGVGTVSLFTSSAEWRVLCGGPGALGEPSQPQMSCPRAVSMVRFTRTLMLGQARTLNMGFACSPSELCKAKNYPFGLC